MDGPSTIPEASASTRSPRAPSAAAAARMRPRHASVIGSVPLSTYTAVQRSSTRVIAPFTYARVSPPGIRWKVAMSMRALENGTSPASGRSRTSASRSRPAFRAATISATSVGSPRARGSPPVQSRPPRFASDPVSSARRSAGSTCGSIVRASSGVVFTPSAAPSSKNAPSSR